MATMEIMATMETIGNTGGNTGGNYTNGIMHDTG